MSNTLRLLMPQWQGGNNPSYSFGAKLLAWLAPESNDSIQVEVPVKPYNGEELKMENGAIARTQLLNQLKSATNIIEAYQPDRIITFGGDCLVSQAPFAYLNEKYNGNLGVLWLDAHPDVSTSEMHSNIHAMVLGNLLGEGEKDFAIKVKVPIKPELVMYGGLQQMSPKEEEIVNRLNIRNASASELSDNSTPILKWIKDNDIKHLAVHLDLDVLDPVQFPSLLLSNLNPNPINAPKGEMTLAQILKIIQDVSKETDIVGFSFAEYLPWDTMNLNSFLKDLPIFK